MLLRSEKIEEGLADIGRFHDDKSDVNMVDSTVNADTLKIKISAEPKGSPKFGAALI